MVTTNILVEVLYTCSSIIYSSDIDRVILSSKLSKKKGSVWKWQKYTRKQDGKKKWKGKMEKKLVKMSYKKWFPGLCILVP